MKRLRSNRLSHLAHGTEFPTPAQVQARDELEAEQSGYCSLEAIAKLKGFIDPLGRVSVPSSHEIHHDGRLWNIKPKQ